MDKERRMMILCLLLAAMSGPVFAGEWKANVVRELEVVVGSCVVVPCSFSHPKGYLPSSKLRGIWHISNDREQRIYYDDATQVLQNFRGRTQLLGDLSRNNCTLEMIRINDHDNGPFCFRIELARTETDLSTEDKFSFVEDCVEFRMLPDPPKPTLDPPETATQGRPYTVTCSVTHTCPSHVPKLTWSRDSPDVVVTETHRDNRFGYWEAKSVLTFTPEVEDDHSEVTCTAKFRGGKTSSTKLTVYVKRTENYNHIIIPTVVAIGTAVIFTVFCILMMKKYKKRIAELQSRDGSMWSRLSRMSRRIRSNDPGPSRSDQRKPKMGAVGLGRMPESVISNSCVEQKVFKARCPSPKSQPKCNNYRDVVLQDLQELDDDYENTADLNTYGNI